MPGARSTFLPESYRIASTVKTSRKQHNDWLGCQIIGEDPATTILRWDGDPGEWMWGLDAWYCKVSRLTFDGRGKAAVGLMRWNNFSTNCELSDLWFLTFPAAVSAWGATRTTTRARPSTRSSGAASATAAPAS